MRTKSNPVTAANEGGEAHVRSGVGVLRFL